VTLLLAVRMQWKMSQIHLCKRKSMYSTTVITVVVNKIFLTAFLDFFDDNNTARRTILSSTCEYL